jgi:hypothetical protein
MERIKELKEMAYEIATKSYPDNCGYIYTASVRLEAMKTYAMLLSVEQKKGNVNES